MEQLFEGFKVNSRGQIEEENQNFKYYQTGGEFPIFSSWISSPGPQVAWNPKRAPGENFKFWLEKQESG